MKKLILLSLIVLFSANIFSQTLVANVPTYRNVIASNDGYLLQGIIIDGDTFPHIKMYPVVIYPKRTFANDRQRRKYNRLMFNVKKVYPYAILIGNYYSEVVEDLQYIPNKRDQKNYIKSKEKDLKDQYEETLTNLTITQGRLLIKLVDRETDHTTFEVIQELKGNMNAYFWQSLAVVFGSTLKSDYDATTEDQYIEEIIAMIENGQL
ncbi:MAG: DUF4294 domain-containing protein [Bacteroidales bacterium]|nr:DUF4294 domain-containing protein [Bacteroidales bacterium]